MLRFMYRLSILIKYQAVNRKKRLKRVAVTYRIQKILEKLKLPVTLHGFRRKGAGFVTDQCNAFGHDLVGTPVALVFFQAAFARQALCLFQHVSEAGAVTAQVVKDSVRVQRGDGHGLLIYKTTKSGV